MNQHHCLECGTEMQTRFTEGRQREVCPACGWIYYVRLGVGVGVILEKDGKLLLLKRGHQPWEGDWNVPAGFVEVDERPAEAAVREALEETGLDVEITGQLGTYWFDDDPRGNGLLVLFSAEILGGEFRDNHEVEEWAYFGRDEIPDNLAKGAHDQVILAWKRGEFLIPKVKNG